ncbi:LPS export ABC transporter permease LptF [Neisseriaceae bacterium PsAf]|nr:LPS export ABC transporter permease LptF [Neisseriaceae bacterium PsAf]
MIYQKQAIKELSISSIGIFFILLIILLSVQLVNLLGQVAKGLISIDLFATAMGVSVIGLLPLLLCITCYISVLMVLMAYWRDSEMIVWLSSGISLKKWIAPISLFILPFVLLLFFLTLYLNPIINEKSFEYSQHLRDQPTIDFIEQGVFVPISNGVIFIEEFDPNTNHLESFFSHVVDPNSGKFEITLAKEGLIDLESGDIKITLNDANRYLGYPNRADFSIFTIPKVEYFMQSNNSEIKDNDLAARKDSLSSRVLLNSDNPVLKSTLMWRLSIPIATIILALLAIPLAYTNPRVNKNYNIIIAIVIFFIYQNSLILMRNLIAKETVGFWTGLLVVHGIMLFLTWLFFEYRTAPRTGFLKFLRSFFRKEAI